MLQLKTGHTRGCYFCFDMRGQKSTWKAATRHSHFKQEEKTDVITTLEKNYGNLRMAKIS